MTFDVQENRTVVSTKMRVKQNGAENTLVLNGEDLEFLSVKVNGKDVNHTLNDTHLTLKELPNEFELSIQNAINPIGNTALMGFYKSGDILCSQNEPEGFRRITYFLDRPDVMSKYTVKIIANKNQYPILLSNGNATSKGDVDELNHYVVFEDPFPKPCYLFAIVAGDLALIDSTFTTMSGKEVKLEIYCDAGNEKRCEFSLQSLKDAMKFDEEVFNLEYDLDVYMIVAVDSFNFGAMENKGLNIFNASCVLADHRTETDANFVRVQKVIAHEYFHNWTGDRVTCRDWFQLTLKEGLTVFRDQEFSAYMHSKEVQRIEDVQRLKTVQFSEDDGPLAHPIQPQSFIEINNFYTPTIYEKGAEVIRMIHTLIGHDTFIKGVDKYFELYDGQAVTTEDFIHAMELASDKKLNQFRNWYHQYGRVNVKTYTNYNEETKTFTLTLEQSCEKGPKDPLHFPFIVGLLGKKGKVIEESLTLEITQKREVFTFNEIAEKPTVSLNRNFSAPICLNTDYSNDDLIFLTKYDTDLFNRYEAHQTLVEKMMLEFVLDVKNEKELSLPQEYIDAFGALLKEDIDPAFKEKMLVLPKENDLFLKQDILEIDETHEVIKWLNFILATTFKSDFLGIYNLLKDETDIGKRALKNRCLRYLSYTDDRDTLELCFSQFEESENMTDRFSALLCLSDIDAEETEKAYSHFYNEYKTDALVMNKWFMVQALSDREGTLERVKGLKQDPVFDINSPNIARALLASFTQNHVFFHSKDGSGYKFVADSIIELDSINPSIASRVAGGFKSIKKLDDTRKKAMSLEMKRILSIADLSKNTYEIISKSLEG